MVLEHNFFIFKHGYVDRMEISNSKSKIFVKRLSSLSRTNLVQVCFIYFYLEWNLLKILAWNFAQNFTCRNWIPLWRWRWSQACRLGSPPLTNPPPPPRAFPLSMVCTGTGTTPPTSPLLTPPFTDGWISVLWRWFKLADCRCALPWKFPVACAAPLTLAPLPVAELALSELVFVPVAQVSWFTWLMLVAEPCPPALASPTAAPFPVPWPVCWKASCPRFKLFPVSIIMPKWIEEKR